MKRIALVVALALLSGCNLPTQPESFIPAISVAMGAAAATDGESPPAPPAPPTPGVCQTCDGEGWLGDGQPRSDCPDCNTKWDDHVFGQPQPEGGDPISAPEATPSARPLPETTPEEPLSDYYAAAEKARQEGKLLIVVIGAEDCRPCQQLARNLNTPAVAEWIAANGVLVKLDQDGRLGPAPGARLVNTAETFGAACEVLPYLAIYRVTDAGVAGGLVIPPSVFSSPTELLTALEATR